MRAALVCLLLSALSSPLAASRAEATHAAVATASPQATQIGLRTLKEGGNAADAAVAIAFTLGVTKPQWAGIGGGGFAAYYDAASRAVWTLDFREVSPGAAKAAARAGVISAAVPGTVAGMAALHERFGSKKWEGLLMPAVALARGGDKSELAATLERIAVSGAREFYDGPTARHIVDDGRAAGGVISLRDLREYKPVWRAPVRIAFRGLDIYTVAPPSAGGLMIGSMLKIVGGLDLSGASGVHLIAEAERRAALDRDKYLGDPAFARVPMRELLSDERAAQWRASINPKRVTPTSMLAEPALAGGESAHTTHFTVVDAQGNIAAVTVTLGDDSGSGWMVPGCGFLLNNSMKDFAAGATPNSIEGNKRMASSMAPTIVLRDGKAFLALGTSGGTAIPAIVANVIIQVANKKSLDDAIAAPRYDQQATPEDIAYEQGRAPKATLDALAALGHGIRASEAIGDVQAVMIDRGKLIAVSDPRHGGSAGGF